MSSLIEKLQKVKLLILDVDGVLTNGNIMFSASGDEMLSFNSRDGHGIIEALRLGLKVAVISGRSSQVVSRRMAELGVTDIYVGVPDKSVPYEALKQKYNLTDDDCAYIGDDVNDVPVLEKVGLSCTPIDGIEYLRECVTYISGYGGGQGCVRDIIEMILAKQGKWKFISTQQA
jgi:3-deoxy-D-manno-octulosonate 8-phosphate phosphatase (KDO 8-P phosphatase)